MKFFIVLACVFVAVSGGYAGPQHIPVIANGVPVDTPEVQLAKSAHFAAKAEAHARNGDFYVASSFVPYGGYYHYPQDTAEVAAAKTYHFAAHAEALARNGHHPFFYRFRRDLSAQHLPVIGPNGVPLDTPEVQHAKAAHFAAKAEAHARNGDYYYYYNPYYSSPLAYAASYYTYPQHIPIINNGVPVETPEVQLAKAAHFAAHAEATARAL